MNENPEAKDSVTKAMHAFNIVHFSEHPHAHNFPTTAKGAMCVWCGRTREGVRYDSLPARCANRPVLKSIQDTIRDEEVKAFSLLKKAEKDVPNLIKKMGMSGATLAYLKGTHGYGPDIVELFAPVSAEVLADYAEVMAEEGNASRASQVKTVIKVEEGAFKKLPPIHLKS